MDRQSACDKCGLKAVRYELERRGIVLRFCDVCYGGELEADGSLVDERNTKTEGSVPQSQGEADGHDAISCSA